ncbi:MAG: hypothetical protein ACLSWD_08620 [Clostridium sp.]
MVTIPIGANQSGDGFIKFPDGILIQWGVVECAENVDTGTFTYPIPFIKDAIRYVFASHYWQSDGKGSVTVGAGNETSVNILVYDDVYGIQKTRAASVLVIGRWK